MWQKVMSSVCMERYCRCGVGSMRGQNLLREERGLL